MKQRRTYLTISSASTTLNADTRRSVISALWSSSGRPDLLNCVSSKPGAGQIVPFLGRMAGPACVVECLLPRLGVGALTRRLLGHGRENQKHQECCADQSRDCGAGHDVLLAIER